MSGMKKSASGMENEMIYNVRKVMALTLAVCISTGAAGCGSSKKKDKDTENIFVIGQLASETGQYSQMGNSVYGGALMAVNEINDDGGVTVGNKTYKLKLIEIDDESNAEIAKSGYSRLKDKDINAFIAPAADELCQEIEEKTNEDNIFTIIPSSTSDNTGTFDNTFKICLSNSQEGIEAAEHGFYNMNSRKGAVLYSENEVEKAEAFIDEFYNCGGNIVAREVYSDDLQSLEANINSIKASGAEVVYIPADFETASNIIQIMDADKMGISVIGSSQWEGITPGTYTGLNRIEYLNPYGDKRTEYENTYEVTYGRMSDLYSAQGYDAVYVIRAAMEEAENIDSDLQICAMDDINLDGATGENISFTDEGYSKRTVEFKSIQIGGINE